MSKIYGHGFTTRRISPRLQVPVTEHLQVEKSSIYNNDVVIPKMSGVGLDEKITSKISKLSFEPKTRKPKNISFELK
tara:strand:+ start:448 stop:678 length:231 start_codon:yes stop_codon:yes gene_type:complete